MTIAERKNNVTKEIKKFLEKKGYYKAKNKEKHYLHFLTKANEKNIKFEDKKYCLSKILYAVDATGRWGEERGQMSYDCSQRIYAEILIDKVETSGYYAPYKSKYGYGAINYAQVKERLIEKTRPLIRNEAKSNGYNPPSTNFEVSINKYQILEKKDTTYDYSLMTFDNKHIGSINENETIISYYNTKKIGLIVLLVLILIVGAILLYVFLKK